MDCFHEAGVRRLEPCQPINDICAMKAQYPDMSFMGGLDLQGVIDNPEATEEDLRKEVRRCVDAYSEGGRYVVFGVTLSMHDPSAYAPGKKMAILMEEALQYKR